MLKVNVNQLKYSPLILSYMQNPLKQNKNKIRELSIAIKLLVKAEFM